MKHFLLPAVFLAAATGGRVAGRGDGGGQPGHQGGGTLGFSGGLSVRGSAGSPGEAERRHDGKTAGVEHEGDLGENQTLRPGEVRRQQTPTAGNIGTCHLCL